MSNTWKRKKVLQRYIITYFLVFSVPLVIFSYIVYQGSVKKISQQYYEIANTAASGVCVDVERLLDSGQSMVLTLRESPYFSSNTIENFAGSFVYIDQMMARLGLLTKDFFQIVFYSDVSDLMYTTSIYKREFYFKNIFKSPLLNENTTFENLSEPMWIPMEQTIISKTPVIVSSLLFPVERGVKSGKRSTSSVLIAHLDEARLRQMVSPITALPDTNAVVFYKGVPIFSNDYQLFKELGSIDLQTLTNDRIFLQGKEYVLQWGQQSEQIAILALVPPKNVKALASDVLRTYLFSLLLSAAIAAFLIFFSVRQNYKPILRLLQKTAGSIISLPEHIKELDEVGQASYAIDSLIESKAKVEIAHKEMQLKHMLLRLLENSSKYSSSASFKDYSTQLNIAFDTNYYICVLFTNCANREELVNTLMKKELPFEGKLFCAGDIDEQSAVMLVCCNQEDTIGLAKLLASIKGLYGDAGIGTFVNNISNVTLSYKQAYYATISTGEKTGMHAYSSVRIMEENEILTQFSKETQLFSDALSRQEQSKMLLSLSRIADLLDLLPNKDPIEMLLHHILFVAVKALAVANIPFSKTTELFGNIILSNKNTAVQDWVQSLANHLSSLLEKSEEQATTTATTSMKDIQYALLYINSNYSKDTFSIQLLADEMGMSISNLSHFFKSKMNKNISDYINELRIAQAKKLLTTTDLKIAEIFPLLGYSHSSSFTKSFKQSTGKTPKQYKTEQQKEIKQK